MPAEWMPHRRCWMAWPSRPEVWDPPERSGPDGPGLRAAREAYARVASAIAEFEPVTMVADPSLVAEVSMMCGGGVSTLPMSHDDSWLRDNGPTFVVSEDDGAVAGVDWRWNAWGGLYPDHADDAAVASRVLDHLKVRRFDAPLVLEGGAFHVDGEGTLLTTEECLLHPTRNPDLDRPALEQLLGAYLGIETVIWLGDGLREDETNGHVDNVACFAAPGVVIAAVSSEIGCPHREALNENLARLKAARDAKGRALEVLELPLPKAQRRFNNAWLPASYVNFYLANGAVILPVFEDPRDDAAVALASQAFPDRRVVTVAATDIAQGGGGIHCITQQQPA